MGTRVCPIVTQISQTVPKKTSFLESKKSLSFGRVEVEGGAKKSLESSLKRKRLKSKIK